MEHLFDNSPFRIYAFCVSVLVVKLLYSAIYTVLRRREHGSTANREDLNVLKTTEVRSQDHPAVARALRIQRNDSESLPAFFAIGLVYVLTGASSFGAWLWCGLFTVSRLVHTYAYVNAIQPLRGYAFLAGSAALAMMSLIVFFRVL